MADDWWAEQEMFGAVTDEAGEPMTTTDTTALQERIARALFLSERWNWHDPRPDREKTPEGDRGQREKMAALWDAEAGKPWHESRWPSFRQEYPRLAAAVLPIIAAEVQAAKAEALREAADGIDLGEIAEEWSQGPGNRNDMHWAAANAASSVVLALHDRATEYEAGDSDERR